MIITREEYEDIKKNPICKSNTGGFGSCYSYGDNKVIKLFHTKPWQDMDNIKKNVTRESNICIYPEELIFMDGYEDYFVGYVMEKAAGVDLTIIKNKIINGEMDISFHDFYIAYYKFLFHELPKETAAFWDVRPEHIFIDKGIHIIDTDQFYSEDSDFFEACLFCYNVRQMNTVLTDYIESFCNVKFEDKVNLDRPDYLFKRIKNIEDTEKVKTFGQLHSLK